MEEDMGSSAPSKPSAPDRRGVRRMLMLFGALAIVGVLMLALSVVLGLFLLVVAEVFFAIAYRRFSRSSGGAG